ncbi:hypothetical protein [Streptomyces canus]|uniref:hypothetical protein n=1 Tax=Streptomyces canus TaxID=58343 RepID=UPI00339DBCA8
MSTPVKVVVLREAVPYDGTNGNFICNTFITPPARLVSETGGVLVYEVQEVQFTVNQGDYVMRESLNDPWAGVVSAAEYRDRYYELPGQTPTPEV